MKKGKTSSNFILHQTTNHAKLAAKLPMNSRIYPNSLGQKSNKTLDIIVTAPQNHPKPWLEQVRPHTTTPTSWAKFGDRFSQKNSETSLLLLRGLGIFFLRPTQLKVVFSRDTWVIYPWPYGKLSGIHGELWGCTSPSPKSSCRFGTFLMRMCWVRLEWHKSTLDHGTTPKKCVSNEHHWNIFF